MTSIDEVLQPVRLSGARYAVVVSRMVSHPRSYGIPCIHELVLLGAYRWKAAAWSRAFFERLLGQPFLEILIYSHRGFRAVGDGTTPVGFRP